MAEAALPKRIVVYPDPRLRQNCAPVKRFDAKLATLAEQMFKLMRENRGVGLAGPQVGVNQRIFVCNPTGNPEDDRVYVNPELHDLSGSIEAEEGCLSIPEVRVIVRRARQCRIKALDVKGEPIEATGEELVARIWQHESDHLEGRLIIDRMTATDRIASKKQLAQLEADYQKQLKKK